MDEVWLSQAKLPKPFIHAHMIIGNFYLYLKEYVQGSKPFW